MRNSHACRWSLQRSRLGKREWKCALFFCYDPLLLYHLPVRLPSPFLFNWHQPEILLLPITTWSSVVPRLFFLEFCCCPSLYWPYDGCSKYDFLLESFRLVVRLRVDARLLGVFFHVRSRAEAVASPNVFVFDEPV